MQKKNIICTFASLNITIILVMKNKSYSFTARYLLIFFLAIIQFHAFSQDNIWECSSLTAKEAIVRNWTKNQYVVYTNDGSGIVRFSVIDPSTSNVYEISPIATLPNAVVNDFEIMKDAVYFCGNYGANAFFGYFDIPTALSGTGIATILPMSVACLSNYIPGGTEILENLLKLEMIPCVDGFHAVMIGEASTTNPHARCIVDLRHTYTPSTWTLCFSQDYFLGHHYDDIAATNSEVVVVGHKPGGNCHYLVPFTLPTTATYHFFPLLGLPHPIYSSWTTNHYYPFPYSSFLIEHIENDIFAIVGYSDCDDYNYGATVSTYNGTPNIIDRCYIPQGKTNSSQWKLKDFRYNSLDGSLHLLQDMNAPVDPSVNSVICSFHLNAGIITGVDASYEKNVPYFSLDQYSPNISTVAVGANSYLRLWHHIGGIASPCADQMALPYTRITAPDAYSQIEIYYTQNANITPITSVLSVDRHRMNPICN